MDGEGPDSSGEHPREQSHAGGARFAILGPVKVLIDGHEAALDGSKQRTVLAALLLARGGLVSDDRLSTLLWGWRPPSTINAQIYTYISRLRKYLGTTVEIIRQRPGYQMRTDGARFDYEDFERLAKQGQSGLRTGQFASAADCYRRALALWRGPALADVTEHLAEVELPRLDEARMVALEGRIESDLALGRHADLVPELVTLATDHPMRERLRAQLMTALFRCDRQAEALEVYHEGRRLLADELGVDPGATLNRAYRGILTGDLRSGPTPDAEREQLATVGADHGAPAMLPPNIADCAGRDAEMAQLLRTLGPHRAAGADETAPIVITGMAGSGKTALALRAAHLSRPDFAGGQLYVDLDGMGPNPKNPFDVLGWFLRALGERDSAIPSTLDERVQLYRSRLARQQVLVVLDDVASDVQVRPLLPSGPSCRVILTSRTYLSTINGARVINLNTFGREEALELLRGIVGPERVAAERHSAERIVELCDGLPLAVRIAGVRLAAKPQWPLERLATRLAEDSRRLDELQRGDLNVRTSLMLSYERLPEPARQTFRLVALLDVPDFPAWASAAVVGTGEQAAEAILESLVDARLLEIGGIDNRGRPRYRYHSLVQLFAREQASHEDSREERRTAVDRGSSAWLRRAEEALKLLAVARVPAGVGGAPTRPSADPADTARSWLESEQAALLALCHQASATGRHQCAQSLTRALTGLATTQS